MVLSTSRCLKDTNYRVAEKNVHYVDLLKNILINIKIKNIKNLEINNKIYKYTKRFTKFEHYQNQTKRKYQSNKKEEGI